jgi:DNA-binding MarR family transcriptional regulator
MNPPSPRTSTPAREAQIDYVAAQLLPRAALLTRLLIRELDADVSRSEAGVLNTLSGGPRRITELAELEGLAQPTMTLLVTRLERQGLVRRDRDPDDGRVVLVSLTEAGADAIEAFRALASVALREYLIDMTEDEIASLRAATETFASMIGALQRGG